MICHGRMKIPNTFQIQQTLNIKLARWGFVVSIAGQCCKHAPKLNHLERTQHTMRKDSFLGPLQPLLEPLTRIPRVDGICNARTSDCKKGQNQRMTQLKSDNSHESSDISCRICQKQMVPKQQWQGLLHQQQHPQQRKSYHSRTSNKFHFHALQLRCHNSFKNGSLSAPHA